MYRVQWLYAGNLEDLHFFADNIWKVSAPLCTSHIQSYCYNKRVLLLTTLFTSVSTHCLTTTAVIHVLVLTALIALLFAHACSWV
jgi:hypothetical protein